MNNKKLLLRLFLNLDVDRLTETNTNAGSILRQIAFDKAVMRQLNNTLYSERIKRYQSAHTLSDDNFNFSEQQLVDYFKGESVNIRKYIIDSLKHSITYSPDNKLKDYRELLKTSVFRSFPLKKACLALYSAKLQGISKNQPGF